MEFLTRQPLAFAHPAWLWAALPPILALLFAILRSILPASKKTKPQKPDHHQKKHTLSFCTIHLACMFVALSLARPYLGEKTITIKTGTTSRQVLIALDVSRSMLVDDVRPNRLERARMLIRSLLDSLAGEQIGLILFAGTAFLQCPMSTDHDVLREILPAIGPDFIPRGGTNYDRMLQTALASFPRDPNATPVLIVLSDGEALDESWRAHIPAISQRGISVITLGIGTQDGGLVPSQKGGFEKHPDGRPALSRLEPRTLQELANTTGGIYLDASQWVNLASVVEQVESRRASAYKREKNIALKNEVFHWPLLAAITLIFWSLLKSVPVHPARRKLRTQPALVSFNHKSIIAPQSMARDSKNTLSALLLLLFLSSHKTAVAQIPTNNGAPLLTPQNNNPTHQNLSADVAREKLLETVKKLSQTAHSTPAADYAKFANDTLNYLESANSQLPAASIRSLALDGLDAVRRGSIRAPAAADWDDLRKKLERWLEENPTPQNKQDQQDQHSQNQQPRCPDNRQQNNSDSQQQQEPNNNENKDSGSQSQNNDQNSQQPAPQNRQSEQSSSNTGQNNEKTQAANTQNKNNRDLTQNNNQLNTGPRGDRPLKDTTQENQQNSRQNKLNESAQPTPAPQPAQRPSTQRIGGQNIRPLEQPLESLPQELRDAIMLLDQAKQNDRPAVLFERMMDRQKTPPDEGKNW